MAKFNTIGVLTSGGDAPGMNNAVRAITRRAIDNGIRVMGIYGGYSGLIRDKMRELTALDVANIENIGGTILYSDRCDEFRYEPGMQTAIATCRRHNIDAIVAIGGDGTFRGATDLSIRGIPTVGIPGSIDNDITSSDYTIGFDTAMNTVTECLDRLRDTCESHARLNVVEVMGRDCGEIALRTGIAAGAMAIAIPEVPFDEEAAIARCMKAASEGKRSMLVVVSEGVFTAEGKPYGEDLCKRLSAAWKAGTFCAEPKFARLAHIVRGGSPTLRDRLTATEMGAFAVDLLLGGKSDVAVIEREGRLCAREITSALANDKMYKKKLADGALDKFTAEQVAEMKALCELRTADIGRLYDIHLSLCMGK
jgi:6-phosphofructokinase 1